MISAVTILAATTSPYILANQKWENSWSWSEPRYLWWVHTTGFFKPSHIRRTHTWWNMADEPKDVTGWKKQNQNKMTWRWSSISEVQETFLFTSAMYFVCLLPLLSADSACVLIGCWSGTRDITRCVLDSAWNTPHTTGFLVANIKHVHYLRSLLPTPSERIWPDKITLNTPHATGKSDTMSFANIR